MKEVLKFHNLKQQFTDVPLYYDVSGELYTGDKVGLIGQNGSGKSTLINILLERLVPDKGTFKVHSEKVGFIPQEFSEKSEYQDLSLLEVCMSINEELNDLYFDLQKLEKPSNKDTDKYLSVLGEFQEKNGYQVIQDIDILLKRVGFEGGIDSILLFSELSEGQKRLVYLIGILSSNPEFLVLDEPTNHVDYTLKEKYIDLIAQYKGAVLVVSHDRELLSKACNKIWEMEDGILKKYKGNWEMYEEDHRTRLLGEIRNYEQREKQIKRFERQIEFFKSWKTEEGAKAAKSYQKKLDRLAEIQPAKRPTFDKPKVKGDLGYEGKSSQFMLRVNDLSAESKDKVLFSNLSMEIKFPERVALVGPNGSGKSTFIKVLLDECDYAEVEGEIKLSPSAAIGYFNQKLLFDDENISLYEYIRDTCDCNHNQVFGLTKKYLFDPSMHDTKISSLSGGEKNRLHLLRLIEGNYNFLILDEPTNHLDLYQIEALEEMLQNYNGSILLISHDRYFVENVAGRIVEIEGE